MRGGCLADDEVDDEQRRQNAEDDDDHGVEDAPRPLHQIGVDLVVALDVDGTSQSRALSSTLAEALWQRRRRSAFNGDDELVFCHPQRGTKIDHEWFAEALRVAQKAAKVDGHLRPFHDLRHTAITNDAATGSSPIAVMAKAGHRSMATTKTYLHLAGVVFRDEADALERRLLGGTKLYRPEQTSDDLSGSNPASDEAILSEPRPA
jgi:hypothetical protein